MSGGWLASLAVGPRSNAGGLGACDVGMVGTPAMLPGTTLYRGPRSACTPVPTAPHHTSPTPPDSPTPPAASSRLWHHLTAPPLPILPCCAASGLAYKPGDSIPEAQDVRTSSGTFLTRTMDKTGTLEWIEKKIAAVTHLPTSYGEAFNVLRWGVGGVVQGRGGVWGRGL